MFCSISYVFCFVNGNMYILLLFNFRCEMLVSLNEIRGHWEVIGRSLGGHCVEVSLTSQILRVWHFVYIHNRLSCSYSGTCTSTCTHDPFTLHECSLSA